MNWKLLSVCILNFSFIFSGIYHIKNDSLTKLFVEDPNSGFAIMIEPNGTHEIDTTLPNYKKIFINETLNFFEELQKDSQIFKLKYQLRTNDSNRKMTEITYNQIKQFANQRTSGYEITTFK